MKKSIILLLSALPFFAKAQNTFTAFLKDGETKEILIAATAYMPALKIGVNTDSSGKIILKNIPDGKYEIQFSYTGYAKKEMEFEFPLTDSSAIEIFLKNESEELGEVVIQTTRTNSRLEEIPIRVEVIGGEELNEKGSMKPANLSMLLSEATGIQPQQTSAVNGNISIRLQGLDGKYTQILKDGFPLYSGFAQGLSIMQIPPLDLKQVEIIKGSASSLYGSDAIGGVINLISKKPQTRPELTFLLNQTSLFATDVHGYYAQRFKKIGISLLSSNSFQAANDVNKDGFSDIPKTRTFSFNPKLYYYLNDKTTVSFGINSNTDYRNGGDMKVLAGKADSTHKFFEENKSDRIASQLLFEKNFHKNQTFTFKNSVSYFNRAINENASSFAGKQINSYTEAAYRIKFDKHEIVSGINFVTEKFTEDTSRSHSNKSFSYSTLGAFLQDDWKPTEKFSLQTGLRVDYQNKYGFFILPRLNALYKFTKQFYVRAGGGLGYKIPSVFSTATEQAGINNVLPLSANVESERSVGANFDFNYRLKVTDESSLTFNQTFFITQINQPLILDTIKYINADKPLLTKGLETSIRYRWDELKIFFGYTYVNAQRQYDPAQTFLPLTPKHKIVLTTVYEKEDNWMVGFEGFYTSTMFRDGDTKTKEYFIIGLIAQKHFKHFSIIGNCENILDARQTRYENIIIPPTDHPMFRQVYAPLDGSVFNVALKIKL
ncbi:MAG: TonB-dependent receptor [Ferruginibacter sp.]|nr:TonB-dependent receptor [Ferruginibacter sp.]